MSFKPPLILLIVLTLLIGTDYLSAWTAPAAVPPASNVAAPLNTSAAGQIKSGGLDLGSLVVNGGTVLRGGWTTLENGGPTLYLNDINNRANFWLHVNGDSFHILGDRDDNGNWWTPDDYQGGWPMQMYLGTNPSQDWVNFSNQVRANAYCDRDGGNCKSAADLGGSGFGYGQQWQEVARGRGIWYQNNTAKPIMVFHKNIWDGTIVYVGPSTSSYTALDFRDFDSDLDNGSTFAVPPGHWYFFGTNTGNTADAHHQVRELR